MVLLKYAGMAVTTCLGVFGLLINFRDKQTDKVTRGGRRLVVGIIVSGMIVVATQMLEDVRSRAEREDIIDAMVQGQYPLRDVRLSFWADLPAKDPRLQSFTNRVGIDATNAREQVVRGVQNVPGVNGWSGLLGRPPSMITICQGSQFYPDRQREPFAASIFQIVEVTLRFYRSPIPVAAYPVRRYEDPKSAQERPIWPDLEMTFRTSSDVCMQFDFDRRGVVVWGSNLETEPRSWNSSGRIVSLVNLRGTQLFIELTPLPLTFGETKHEPSVTPLLRSLVLRIGELDGLWLHVDQLTKHSGIDGAPFYEYRFPSTMDEILDLAHKR
ncbi:MAG: hypothetical protein QOI58_1229 [Thermoanaerobaculia bacterium]|nr:hypothetical protein [Thermoanaerobaculia bacterium]